MCLIVALFKVIPGFPLIVGANRDESYSRLGEPPRAWNSNSRIIAGRDPVAGGTWLGVNLNGVVVALSNRNCPQADDPTYRSRGLLCLDALEATSAAAAIKRTQESLGTDRYNPFNLFCADARQAAVLHHSPDTDRVVELTPGTHALTTGDVNDATSARIKRAHAMVAARRPTEADEAVELLQGICRDHGGGEPSPQTLCMHGKAAGTVSSSIVVLNTRGNLEAFHYAQGFPCRTEYKMLFALA